ncbi:hypothetical protein P692DRAFT_20881944 [Suillus brevipes Sb2]|nr:hypothetical protein P692DRAFT_20881944 [Suillus brevipes Sb2]
MPSDWDSCSADSRPSDFNDGAEEILRGANLEIEVPKTGEEDNRCSTPESHKDCTGYNAHGQGTSVYSCGCYKYREMARYKYRKPSPSPSDLQQASESGNGNFGDIRAISLKQKAPDENDTSDDISREITAMWEPSVPSVPDINVQSSKRRKIGGLESLEETRSLLKIAKEVVVLGEALVRMKDVLDGQSMSLLMIWEALSSLNE